MNDQETSKDRIRAMSACTSRALQTLRRRHQEEFADILRSEYTNAGLVVRQRLTGERARKAKIERARRIIEMLEARDA